MEISVVLAWVIKLHVCMLVLHIFHYLGAPAVLVDETCVEERVLEMIHSYKAV